MGDFNDANLCDSDCDAVLIINISPYQRTNHAYHTFRYRGMFRFMVGFSVTVMAVKLAILVYLASCSLLEYHK